MPFLYKLQSEWQISTPAVQASEQISIWGSQILKHFLYSSSQVALHCDAFKCGPAGVSVLHAEKKAQQVSTSVSRAQRLIRGFLIRWPAGRLIWCRRAPRGVPDSNTIGLLGIDR